MKKPIVYVVHCIDTEGPLYQSTQAICELLQSTFKIKVSSQDEILALQKGDFSHLAGGGATLDSKAKEAIQTFLDPHLLHSHGSWEQIDVMLESITAPAFRNVLLDSFGGGWIYNWFCMDHTGFDGYNPRRRDAGYHNIFDHYAGLKSVTDYDHLSFHYHPLPFIADYHASGTRFWGSNITEILSRRLIDRHFFPSTFRPGFHTERPDSHFFLEQWIPFDYANQSTKGLDTNQPDCGDGRFGDWRRATTEWEVYHPSHDDYQVKGSCRRYIARCLNMYARLRCITQDDVNDAFQRALKTNDDVILAFDCHDYRDMSFEVNLLRDMIKNASLACPQVHFKYEKADVAMRAVLNLDKKPLNLRLEYDFSHNKLHIQTDSNIFGPQPFLAIKTTQGQYFHDNFDFYQPYHWTYTFDRNTIPPQAIEKIGVASNTNAGVTELIVWDKATNTQSKTTLNNA
ncbi:hypothetical protein [Helicobacter cinaedi]|uniref:hypothetical protein n=1 Tax=Helicobacter cinaedi TaxID=213 RepID=UPI000D7BD005|nr:hypothetical protein [Helicobacter cinaedi]